jgi:hypothetical protein
MSYELLKASCNLKDHGIVPEVSYNSIYIPIIRVYFQEDKLRKIE